MTLSSEPTIHDFKCVTKTRAEKTRAGLKTSVEVCTWRIHFPKKRACKMPLGRSDADRGLDLLWEFHREAEGDEERAAYAEAIASLHSYLTDLLPASQPLLRARAKEGFVDVRPLHETPVQSVVLTCNEGEKLGLSIDCVSLSKWGNSSDVSPYVVSLVKPGSAADREGSLRRGDQLVEVDGRPLAHVSLERARLSFVLLL